MEGGFNMNISVVMSTYNGEEYLYELLESLYKQTKSIYEVVIIDDCSTDNTVNIINNFIDEKKITNFHIYINDCNCGWKINFIEGFEKATGDIIFPCDQDDIWYSDKIERMEEIMSNNDEIMVLASNYTPFYSKGSIKISSKITNQFKNDGNVYKYRFNEKFLLIDRPGCVYCFRKDFYTKIKSDWISKYSHDTFLWVYSNIYDGLYIFDYATIKYRRHNSNASSFKENLLENYKTYIYIILQLKKQIEKVQIIKDKEYKIEILNKGLKWCNYSINMFELNKLIFWFEIIPYYKFYRSLKSMFKAPCYLIIQNIKDLMPLK
jgi:glycosyltransferase involved in cell wall biosynthesis